MTFLLIISADLTEFVDDDFTITFLDGGSLNYHV